MNKVTPFHGSIIAINSFGFGGENVHAVIKRGQEPVNTKSPVHEETSCKVNGKTNGRPSSYSTSNNRITPVSNLPPTMHKNHIKAEIEENTSTSRDPSNSTPQPVVENKKRQLSKLIVISARTTDSAQNLLQLAADHCNEDETLAFLDTQINVPPSVFPARGYATITGDGIVKYKQAQVGCIQGFSDWNQYKLFVPTYW